MKKYNEGYALPFVLVVFLVLSLIATSILTFSLQNLQSQQASIQRTKDQYAAQGEIEKVVAQLKNSDTINDTDRLRAWCANTAGVEYSEWKAESGVISFKLIAQSGSVQIACVIKLTNVATTVQNGLYSIENATTSYESYTVTTNGGSTE